MRKHNNTPPNPLSSVGLRFISLVVLDIARGGVLCGSVTVAAALVSKALAQSVPFRTTLPGRLRLFAQGLPRNCQERNTLTASHRASEDARVRQQPYPGEP